MLTRLRAARKKAGGIPRPRTRAALLWLGLAGLISCGSNREGAGPPPITFESLLEEMVDRDTLARFPDPAYVCRQFSSYQRLSVTSDDDVNWFANQDWSHFIGEEEVGGHTEWVMMDVEGPGAIVRIWATGGEGGIAPDGVLRFYLDGATEPVIEENAVDLFDGGAIVGPPLAEVTANGRNLFLPIPYADHCKVTFEGPNFWDNPDFIDFAGAFWYHVEYRRYPAGTPVQTFTTQALGDAQATLDQVQSLLLTPADGVAPGTVDSSQGPLTLGADESTDIELSGPGAIRKLAVRIDAADQPAALRSTLIRIRFDGTETVNAPVSDFFGSGYGVNPFVGWWREVSADGWMTCYWVMPFEDSCTVTLHNTGAQEVDASITLGTGDWTWDERSMYFHTNWISGDPLTVPPIGDFPKIDWSYLRAAGKGVLVGDTLALFNPVTSWWGEGDEKIYVDGETFPSHFGTGTEDYYGYAWARTDFFETPFHSQPRADGPGKSGHITNIRSRSLDAIPFTRSLRFDMEVWHKNQTGAPLDILYNTTTHWYQFTPDVSAAGSSRRRYAQSTTEGVADAFAHR